MNEKRFVAIDLGATSGRVMLSTLKGDKLEIEEKHRFVNKIIKEDNYLCWDIHYLFESIVEGLKVIAKETPPIESIGIDTWGVDFVVIDKAGKIAHNPLCYRDPHTLAVMDDFFKELSSEALYGITGTQVMNINTLFQLYALKKQHRSINKTSNILFMPDAIAYLLTGNKATEYTIASTSQLINAQTRDFDERLLKLLGIDKAMFPKIVFPGTEVGVLSDEIQKATGLGAIRVVNVASHDTASAISAIPATEKHYAYLCSGTWSLMGIETEQPIINEESYKNNFTNEGGANGKICFLRNSCGMWILEQCRKEWGEAYSYKRLIEEAEKAMPFQFFINPDAACFSSPTSMIEAIHDYLKLSGQAQPTSVGEVVRCIFESMAMKYKEIFLCLKDFAEGEIEKLYVLGGGAKNRTLNQYIANSLGITVVKAAEEASTLGNVMLQATATNSIASIEAARTIVGKAIVQTEYLPQEQATWEDAYLNYKKRYQL